MSPCILIALCAADTAVDVAALASALPAGAETAPEWVQLTPVGQSMSNDGRGPWDFGDLPALQAIVAASAIPAGGLPVDFDHAIDLAAPKGLPAPAAGWITAMEARPDGIWGRVEWTAQAAAQLQAKAYRFISPVFNHTKAGRVTKILRAGLTNNPALNLVALAAANPRPDNSGASMELLALLLAALGLPATTDQATALAAVKAMAQTNTDQATTLASLAEKLGLDTAAKPAEIQTALAAKVATPTAPDLTKFVPLEQYTALASQLQQLQAGATAGQAESEVEKAIAAGKILPATRAHYVELAKQDLGKFTALMAATPAVFTPGATLSATPAGGGGGGLTAEEKQICANLGLAEDTFLKAKKEG